MKTATVTKIGRQPATGIYSSRRELVIGVAKLMDIPRLDQVMIADIVGVSTATVSRIANSINNI